MAKDPSDPGRSAVFTILRSISPATRQVIDENIEMAVREAKSRGGPSKVVLTLDVTYLENDQQADFTISTDLKVAKVASGVARCHVEHDGTVSAVERRARSSRLASIESITSG